MSTLPAAAARDAWLSRLNFRHLQQLVTLEDLGSISDTARALSSTQPALSKWLRELEDEIGEPLFERHARGLSPTGHGRVLLDHARRMLSEVERVQQDLSALNAGSSYRVIIGVAPAAVTTLVPTAIRAFLAQHPGASIEVREGTMSALLRRLDLGELDLAVGTLDEYQPAPRLASEALYRESLQVVARKRHPLARGGKRLGWDDLLRYEWVLWPRDTANRAKLDMALSLAGAGPVRCSVESTSLLSNIALVQQSDLLCALSSRLAGYFGPGLTTLDFDLAAGSTIGMVWRDEPLQQAATADMLAHLRACSAQAWEDAA